MVAVVLGVKFLLEVVALIAVGAGAHALVEPPVLKWGAAVAAPLALAVAWGLVIAPNSPYRLDLPWLVLAELVVFAIAAGGLWIAVRPLAAVVFGVLVLVDTAALLATRQYA